VESVACGSGVDRGSYGPEMKSLPLQSLHVLKADALIREKEIRARIAYCRRRARLVGSVSKRDYWIGGIRSAQNEMRELRKEFARRVSE
jgi:hypothetical protein